MRNFTTTTASALAFCAVIGCNRSDAQPSGGSPAPPAPSAALTTGPSHAAMAMDPPDGAGMLSTGDAAHPLYTCVMHPEIVRSEPGTCPICRMKLVVKTAP